MLSVDDTAKSMREQFNKNYEKNAYFFESGTITKEPIKSFKTRVKSIKIDLNNEKKTKLKIHILLILILIFFNILIKIIINNE